MKMTVCWFTVLVLRAGSAVLAGPPSRNFVFILADDLGVKDLSVQGSSFHGSKGA